MVIASVVIPTYNRCESLNRAIKSIAKIDFPSDHYEVIVVDNNSNDDTRKVVRQAESYIKNLRYIWEPHLFFSVARNSGGVQAEGEFLVYIDDDVTVTKEWLREIVKTFRQDASIGMIAGAIKPIFEKEPPDWILNTPNLFNGLSLCEWGDKPCEAKGACGPNLGIRKSLFEKVKGFPPDTIGVETEKPGTIEKIYIGPGDWGLGLKVKALGYRIMYIPSALVYHHIPPIRLTKKWWHSRLAGEGCFIAIYQQHENRKTRFDLLKKSIVSILQGIKMLVLTILAPIRHRKIEQYEFKVSFHFSQARVEFVLAMLPRLADELWQLGETGVLAQDTKRLLRVVRLIR